MSGFITFHSTATFGDSMPTIQEDTYPVEFRQTDKITHELGMVVNTPWDEEIPVTLRVVMTFDPAITWAAPDDA